MPRRGEPLSAVTNPFWEWRRMRPRRPRQGRQEKGATRAAEVGAGIATRGGGRDGGGGGRGGRRQRRQRRLGRQAPAQELSPSALCLPRRAPNTGPASHLGPILGAGGRSCRASVQLLQRSATRTPYCTGKGAVCPYQARFRQPWFRPPALVQAYRPSLEPPRPDLHDPPHNPSRPIPHGPSPTARPPQPSLHCPPP
jgi:hypothetical protein